MRWFLAVVFVGLAAASSHTGPFRPGTEYVFQYHGRLLTGLPELATHYSGLAIKAQVRMQVTQENEYRIAIQDGQYAKINQQMQAEGTDLSRNWRELPISEYQGLPSNTAKHLGEPSILKLSPGSKTFQSLTVSDNEPAWSVNFKKALAALFTVNIVEPYSGVSENMLERHSAHESLMGDSDVSYWQTQEESLEGLCQITYQVNELPAYMAIENQQDLYNVPSACGGSIESVKFYEIVRSRDVASCSHRASIFNFLQPGNMKCNRGNCDGQSTRSAVTRYFACGPNREDMRIQSVVNEGESEVNMVGFTSERFVSGTKQNLTLVQQKHIASQIPKPTSPVETKTLAYEQSLFSSASSYTSSLPYLVSKVNGKKVPEGISAIKVNTVGKDGGFDAGKVAKDIEDILVEIVKNELHKNLDDQRNKDLPIRLLEVSRGFSVLKQEQIRKVYQQTKSRLSGNQEQKQTFTNVFFDTLVMAGTNPAIEFFLEQAKTNKELSDLQLAAIFTLMPNYVLVPTPNILNGLYDLVQGETLRSGRSDIVYSQAVMGLTALVHKACVADNRLSNYPVAVYGEQCYPESEIVVDKLIPFFQGKLANPSLASEDRTLYIVALGQLGHKNGLSILFPIMQGPTSTSSSSSSNPDKQRMERLVAIFSVSSIGKRYPGLVESAIFTLLSNQADQSELRIAAFNALLSLDPPQHYLHRVAIQTWEEKDQQLLRVINSAFFSLSQRTEVDTLARARASLPHKAATVYPLVKKPDGRYPSSATIVNIDYLHQLGGAYQEEFSWTSSSDSYVPINFYHRMQQLLNKYQITSYEYAHRLVGGENLIQSLVELVTPGQSHLSRREVEESIKKTQLSPQWREVIDQLKLKVKESDLSEVAYLLNMFETAPIFKTLQASSPAQLKEKVGKLLNRNDFELKKLCGTHQVNFQRVMKAVSAVSSHPSEMGLPLLMEYHMPRVLSIKGTINIDCNAGTIIPKFDLKASKLAEASTVAFVGTVTPFTDESLYTGVEQTFLLNLPVEIDLNVDSKQQQITANIKTTPVGVSSGFDLFHYRLIPFTVASKINSVESFVRSSQFRNIQSPTAGQEKQWQFGQKYLGLNFALKYITESRFADFRAAFEKLDMFNMNPLNLLRFPWITSAMSEKMTPSLRKHVISVNYQPSSSATKEIQLRLKYGAASKIEGEPIKYNTAQLVNEKLQSYPEWKKLIPVKYESKPIGEYPGHKVRQQKLKHIIEQAEIKTGFGWIVDAKLNLAGGPSNYHYVVSHASGSQDFLKQSWNMQVEQDGTQKVLCLKGQLDIPRSPLWKLDQIRSSRLQFQYNNVIGFGKGCSQQVTISGSSQVSQKQKDYSRHSPEARQLQKMKEEQNVPLADLSPMAHQVRAQATTFDQAAFTIRYQNVPDNVVAYSRYFAQYAKSMMWPYLVVNSSPSGSSPSSSGSISSGNFEVDWQLNYNEITNTMDVTMVRPEETIVFQHVRMPSALNYFLPLNAIQMVERAQRTHSSAYATCQAEGRWLQTFDNQTTTLAETDKCFHVVAADCSYRKAFAVLARNITSGRNSPRELKVLLGKTDILLTPIPSPSGYSAGDYKIKVNGSEVSVASIKASGRHTIKDSKKDYIGDIYLSKDGVITLKLSHCILMNGPAIVVKFDGYRSELKVTPMYRSSLCGLCGDLSGQKLAGLVGPEGCAYSKPELLTAAYRVSTASLKCPDSLPADIESQLRKEKSECVRRQERGGHNGGTPLVRSFEDQVGPCSRDTHQVLELPDRVCFSKRPVVSCSPICKASKTTSKSIAFACMPKGRVAERYAEKIRRGQIIPELEGMPTAFSAELTVPRSCERVH